MAPDADGERLSLFGRIRKRVGAMERQAIYWALFVVVVLLAALIVVLIVGPGSPCGNECGFG